MLGSLNWGAIAFEGSIADAAIEVPGHAERICCRVCAVAPSRVAATPGEPSGVHDVEPSLAIALAEERSGLGAGLVRALWFDLPVALWLPIRCAAPCGASGSDSADAAYVSSCLRIEARVWRCHIAGALFSDVLARVRAEDAAADIASAWELKILSTERIDGSMPAAAAPSRAPRAELHLDRLLP